MKHTQNINRDLENQEGDEARGKDKSEGEEARGCRFAL